MISPLPGFFCDGIAWHNPCIHKLLSIGPISTQLLVAGRMQIGGRGYSFMAYIVGREREGAGGGGGVFSWLIILVVYILKKPSLKHVGLHNVYTMYYMHGCSQITSYQLLPLCFSVLAF